MRAKDITKLTTFHDELNPELWQNNNLKREVEYKLLQVAKAFIEFIDIPDLKLEDITISGSNCSYNYNDQSDIDLHLIVDSDQPCWEPLNALFMAKKSLFNDQHDIKIRGNAVEVYVQDAKQPHISNGIYSVIRDKWIKQPKKITDTPDKTNALHKYEFLKHEIEQAIASDDPTAIVKTQARIKDMRKAGLAKNGEFGAENLAFKMLRNDGSLEDLYNAATVAQDKRLSLPENFADGKVKGKSRPGRVKKAGASCKGSVTSLRQKAKKYGGERGKMYHWCANMKSGRNKG